MDDPHIDRIDWDEWSIGHIAKHDVSRDEVEEVIAGEPVFRESYKGRITAIGPTKIGRMVTVVLGPAPNQPGVYYTFSARPASRKERRRYQDARGGKTT